MLTRNNLRKLIGIMQWQYHHNKEGWTDSDGKLLLKLHNELKDLSHINYIMKKYNEMERQTLETDERIHQA